MAFLKNVLSETGPEFEFRNFIPTASTESSANATLEWLREILPPHSELSASVCQLGAKYLCRVDAYTSLGLFHGEAIECSAQESVDSAVTRVKEAVHEWSKMHLGLDGESYVELMTSRPWH